MQRKNDTSRMVLSTESTGATVRTYYVEGEVIIYPIEDSKLETLSWLGGFSTGFFATGTGIMTFGLGILADLVINEIVINRWAVFTFILCGLVSVVSYVIAGFLVYRKAAMLSAIRRRAESTTGKSGN